MISWGVKCTPFSKLIGAAEAITCPIKIENFSKINTICFIYFCTRFKIMFLLEVFSWWCAMSSTIHNTIMCAEYACFIIWHFNTRCTIVRPCDRTSVCTSWYLLSSTQGYWWLCWLTAQSCLAITFTLTRWRYEKIFCIISILSDSKDYWKKLTPIIAWIMACVCVPRSLVECPKCQT